METLMNLYVVIAGGVCQAVYYTGDKNKKIWVTIIDYDNDPDSNIQPPPLERKYLY
jgi:hypothetical protein